MLMLTSSMVLANERPIGTRAVQKIEFQMPIVDASHKGALHHPIIIGDFVQLEDGSIWEAHESDKFKTHSWFSDDTLKIVPNPETLLFKFIKHPYVLVNLNTDETVRVKLYDKIQGTASYYVTGYHSSFDYPYLYHFKGIRLHISDGSRWDLPWSSKASSWEYGDRVIIGHRHPYDTTSYTPYYIIINCETLSHVEADLIK